MLASLRCSLARGRDMPVGLLLVMPLNHRDLWDTRHVKSELAARAMPEGKVFLYFLAITTFDWLQFTAFRIRPNPESLSLSAHTPSLLV